MLAFVGAVAGDAPGTEAAPRTTPSTSNGSGWAWIIPSLSELVQKNVSFDINAPITGIPLIKTEKDKKAEKGKERLNTPAFAITHVV